MSLCDYNDEYPTCLETYSTLRIASDDVRPEVISKLMGVGPSRSFHKGEAVGKSTRLHKFNAWLYSTRHSISSRDTRRHIDAILEALEGKDETIKKIQCMGCRFNIVSYWVGVGQGGPTIEHQQMKRLGELEISIWWDVYFGEKNDYDDKS